MIVALDNIRSLYNVGSILRTCAFYGVRNIILIGYTGIVKNGDQIEIHPKIRKTSMSGIDALNFKFFESREEFIKYCYENGVEIVSLEQDKRSVQLEKFKPKINSQVYVLGNEVLGVSENILDASAHILEIKVKEGFYHSLNVTVAAGIMVSHLSKFDKY
jgi:tRNA G18 (ribose-2'-O)-methylase SpoU